MTADTAPLTENEKWYRAGRELYAFHPSASHVDPDYRDGWNHAVALAEPRIAALEQQLASMTTMTNDAARPECFDFAMSFLGGPENEVVEAYVSALEQQLAAARVDADPIQALIREHAALIEAGENYAYFELAYTRQTGWMAWLTDRPGRGEAGTAEHARSRKVIARGSGDTAEAACADALAAVDAARAQSSQEQK